MQTFDIIFGIFVLVLVILGIKRGFIEEIMRLIAVIAGFVGALVFYRQFIPKIAFLKFPHEMAAVASFLIIFLGAVIAIVLLGKIIKKVMRLTMLGFADRLGGACFGFMKAVFIGWIFVIAASSLPLGGFAGKLRKSKTYSFFETISPVLKSHVPPMTMAPLGKIPPVGTLHGLGDTLKKLWGKNADTAHARKSPGSRFPSVNSDSI
ncbi:MAG: CvpA family protein [Chitinivibrionales bacterium]